MGPKSLLASRRIFLIGSGVTMALPWMESLPVWGVQQERAVGDPTATSEPGVAVPPRRFAALFMGNGISPKNWWARQAETGEMELGPSLTPLKALTPHLNVISGLFNKQATGVGIHPGQTGNILSGASLQRGAVLRGGISMDQVIAAHFADVTPQPSLVLGCEQPITGYHETNFSMAYSSHISWQDSSSPVPMEVYPSLAFDSLFENHGSRRTTSILDRVSEHARSLRRQLSHADQEKLDEYLQSVRQVERRVERSRKQLQRAGENAAPSDPPLVSMPRPRNGLPEDLREHMRLMADIVSFAFQTDRTRVATLLMCRDLSGLFYPFLDVRVAHHPASHEDNSEPYERIVRYYVSQFAYLGEKLAAMPEGESNVLENSCLMFISNMWSGSQHDSTRLPVLLLGSLGRSLETNRVIDYTGKADDQRRLCSLYLSLMQRMGVPARTFGDAEQGLKEIRPIA